MNRKRQLILLTILASILLSSCVSRKKLTYLQYAGMLESKEMESVDNRMTVTPSSYKIMPYDNLYIRVITPDPQWSTIFNSVPVGQGGSLTEESASLLGYPVDANGYIEIPFVGQIQVSGKTLNEVKNILDTTFVNYVKDASISVRLVNNYISIIGEVSMPGRYPLTRNRVNIFEALSMAGDLGDYSDRRRIQLIRPSPFGPIVKEFSLSDRSILSSEFYHVMPNDIIYAQPMRGKTFQMNSSIYSMILGMVNTVLVILAFNR